MAKGRGIAPKQAAAIQTFDTGVSISIVETAISSNAEANNRALGLPVPALGHLAPSAMGSETVKKHVEGSLLH